MYIELEQVRRFKAKDLEQLGELEFVSEWEGFTKLKCKDGFLIVMDERSCIAKSFDDIAGKSTANYAVVSASPEVAEMLPTAANDKVSGGGTPSA